MVDVVADGNDQLFKVLENAAAELIGGQVAKEAFDHIEPRGRSGGKVHVETLMALEPALHTGMLVGRVVVADEINLLFCGDGLIHHTQEVQPFLMAVSLLAQAVDFSARISRAANRVVVPLRL